MLVPGPSGPAGPGLSSAVLSPDGSTVAFGAPGPGGATVWLLDAATMRVAASIALGDGSGAVVFSPDGRSLADVGFGGQPGAARIWRLEAIGSTALNLTASAAAPRAPRVFGGAAFSPDGGYLAVSGDTGLSLLNAATLRTVRSIPAPAGVPGGPVYRPDGQVLAVGGAPGSVSRAPLGGAVCLLDAASLGMIARRSVPDLDAYSLTFSPDGRTLAVVGHGQAAGGGVVRLLDAASLRTLATAALPGGPDVTAAAAAGFTPDGTVLAGYSVAVDAVAWLMQRRHPEGRGQYLDRPGGRRHRPRRRPQPGRRDPDGRLHQPAHPVRPDPALPDPAAPSLARSPISIYSFVYGIPRIPRGLPGYPAARRHRTDRPRVRCRGAVPPGPETP